MGLGSSQLVGQHAHLIGKLIVGIDRHAINGEDHVALLQADLISRRGDHRLAVLRCGHRLQHGVHLSGDEGTGKLRRLLQHVEKIEIAGKGNAHRLALTLHIRRMCLGEIAVDIHVEILELTEIRSEQLVVITEAELLGLIAELHAIAHLVHAHIALAPVIHDHRIDEQGQQEIDQHTADHYQQTLPGRMGAELPWLRSLLHLLCVEALVDHARDLAIATQRQPAHAVFRIAFELEAEELATPLADADIEEDKEFLHTDAEELREEHVATLMEQHEKREV